jgi:hypothetical protein
MGLSDSFYDEDSKCPKCQRRVRQGWQTKRLESLMESWRKGDFFQYTKWETIPERERRNHADKSLSPFIRKNRKYLSNVPLVFNGKVPVHASCENCNTWIEAYAKITSGKFVGIVEAEATGKEKELVTIPRTAKMLRAEFESRLSQLQESCEHEKSKWMPLEWAPGHLSGRVRVCNRCEKILESDEDKCSISFSKKCSVHGTMTEESGFCPRCAEEWP